MEVTGIAGWSALCRDSEPPRRVSVSCSGVVQRRTMPRTESVRRESGSLRKSRGTWCSRVPTTTNSRGRGSRLHPGTGPGCRNCRSLARRSVMGSPPAAPSCTCRPGRSRRRSMECRGSVRRRCRLLAMCSDLRTPPAVRGCRCRPGRNRHRSPECRDSDRRRYPLLAMCSARCTLPVVPTCRCLPERNRRRPAVGRGWLHSRWPVPARCRRSPIHSFIYRHSNTNTT